MSTLHLYLDFLGEEEPTFQNVHDFLYQKKSEGVTNATIARYLATLRLFFDMLGKKADLSPLKTPTVEQEEAKWLPKEEIEIFLDQAPTPKWKAIYTLMYAAALRVDECAQTQIEDIQGLKYSELRGEWIVLPDHPGRLRIPAAISKSRKFDFIILDVRTRETICAYLNTRTDTRPWLFPGKKDHLSESTIRKKIAAHCEACGITPISSQGLRHSRITHLILAWYPIAKVQRFARHAHISTTMRYVHLRPDKDLEDLPPAL